MWHFRVETTHLISIETDAYSVQFLFIYILTNSIRPPLRMLAPFLKDNISLKYFSGSWEENSGACRIAAVLSRCFLVAEGSVPPSSCFSGGGSFRTGMFALAGARSVLWVLHPRLDGARTCLGQRTSLFFHIELCFHMVIFKEGTGRVVSSLGEIGEKIWVWG